MDRERDWHSEYLEAQKDYADQIRSMIELDLYKAIIKRRQKNRRDHMREKVRKRAKVIGYIPVGMVYPV
jgi:hypothetical protein